jgi:hypothetical protein
VFLLGHNPILAENLSAFEKLISKNDIFCLRLFRFAFIDNQQGRETSSSQQK